MSEFLSRQPLPLNLRHRLAAEDQRSELVHEPVFLRGVIIGKIAAQFLEKFTFPRFVAVQTEPHERCDGLAHAGVGHLRVARYFLCDASAQTYGVAGFGFPRAPTRGSSLVGLRYSDAI